MKTHSMLKPNLARERQASLNRRHFLRGLGACLALPAFESIRPLNLLADAGGASAKTAPLRMAFFYVPNGTIPSA